MAKRKTYAPINTPVFRMAFPALFSPKTTPSGTERYSVTMMFPKDQRKELAQLQATVMEVGKDKWGDAFEERVKAGTIKLPFKDGDQPNRKGTVRDEFKGHIIVEAASQQKPGVVDDNVQAILDPDQCFGGRYAIAQVNAYAWSHPTGGDGVSLGLINIQVLLNRGGERFGVQFKAEEAFTPVESGIIEGDDPLLTNEEEAPSPLDLLR